MQRTRRPLESLAIKLPQILVQFETRTFNRSVKPRKSKKRRTIQEKEAFLRLSLTTSTKTQKISIGSREIIFASYTKIPNRTSSNIHLTATNSILPHQVLHLLLALSNLRLPHSLSRHRNYCLTRFPRQTSRFILQKETIL